MDLGHGARGLPVIGLRPELAFSIASLGCRVVNLTPKAATAAAKRIGSGWVGIYGMDRIGKPGAVSRRESVRRALDDIVGSAKETGWVDVLRERGEFYALAREGEGVVVTAKGLHLSCIVAIATLQRRRHWPTATGVPWHQTGMSGLKLDKIRVLGTPIKTPGRFGLFTLTGYPLRDLKSQVGP